MSDDERDIDDTAEKRAHHNALERKRRDHIKDSFCSLRESVPSLQGEKVASRAQILKKASDYIMQMRKKNSSHRLDIDNLRRQNSLLEAQIHKLEKTKATGAFAVKTSGIDAENYEDSDSGSEANERKTQAKKIKIINKKY